MTPQVALLIGTPANARLLAPGAWSPLALVAVADLPAAARWLATSSRAPAVVAIAHGWPGEIDLIEVERLRRKVPLARVCTLLGSWSEGEPRSGHPWPAAYRLYEHQAEARLARELPRLSAGSPGGWNLPVTAGDEERLLASEPIERRHGLISIVADHFCTAEALTDLCHWRGYQTLAARDPRQMHLAGASAVLWDTTAARAADAARVASLRRHLERPSWCYALFRGPMKSSICGQPASRQWCLSRFCWKIFSGNSIRWPNTP